MNPAVQEWINLAEGDYISASWQIQNPSSLTYHVVCNLSQQSVEKYFKARLQQAGIAFPYTHDLIILLNLLLPLEPSWTSMQADLTTLNRYGVGVRYPGLPVNQADAQEALRICTEVRLQVRQSLGLP